MQGCPSPPLLRPPPLLVASERGGLTRYGQGRHPLGTSTHAFASEGRGLARRGALCWAPAAEWGVPRNSEFTNQPLVPHGWDQVKASESGRCLPGLHVESRVLGWERPRQKSPQAFALTRRESQGETGHNQKRENVRQLRAKVRCDRSRSLEGRAGRGPGAPSLGRSPHCPRPTGCAWPRPATKPQIRGPNRPATMSDAAPGAIASSYWISSWPVHLSSFQTGPRAYTQASCLEAGRWPWCPQGPLPLVHIQAVWGF